MKVNAILLKPLDGDAEGSEREFDRADFDMLEKLGAVREVVVAPPPPPPPAPELQPQPALGGYEKAADAPENKMASEPENKGARRGRAKAD